MIRSIKSHYNESFYQEHNFKIITFPGGEPHVKIDFNDNDACADKTWEIDAVINSFNALGELLCVTNAIKLAWSNADIQLIMHYAPGARQDRYLRGEALTSKVYAEIINAQGYSDVEILDPHSPTITALINNVSVLDHNNMISQFVTPTMYDAIICPDAGAEKRVYETAKVLGINKVINCRKHRSMATGELTGFSVEQQPIRGERYLLVDDICDGGGTFLGLANTCFPDSKTQIDLWVTHGIFSQGVEKLLQVYNRIGCSDSLYPLGYDSDKVEIIRYEGEKENV